MFYWWRPSDDVFSLLLRQKIRFCLFLGPFSITFRPVCAFLLNGIVYFPLLSSLKMKKNDGINATNVNERLKKKICFENPSKVKRKALVLSLQEHVERRKLLCTHPTCWMHNSPIYSHLHWGDCRCFF